MKPYKDLSTEEILDEMKPSELLEVHEDPDDKPQEPRKLLQEDVYDVNADLVQSVGEMAIQRRQEIPDAYLRELRQERDASTSTPAGEFHRFASIPVAVVEMWKKRDGFDVYKEKPKAIIKKLKAEGLDAFLTSNKRM